MNRNLIRHIMKLKIINILFITLLMAMVGVNTAYADERDMDTWSENNGFGKNGANLTDDGYSLWDGWSFQNYELRTSGEQQGIHICNAAQLARYAYDMFNYNNSYWSDRHTRDVWLECDIDLNNKYFSILRSNYYIENATFYGQGHVIRNGYAVDAGGRCALFSDIRGGEIRDLALVNYNLLNPSVSYCGILCGYAENTNTRYPTIRNCRVTNCFTGIENGSTYVGGIVGYAEYISLYDNAVVNCKVETEDNIAGGIVGYLGAPEEAYTEIHIERNRVVNSTVHAIDDCAGGIIGHADVDVITPVYIFHNYVQNCDVICGGDEVLAGDHVGGLIGSCQVRRITASYNYVHAKVIAMRGSCKAGLCTGLLDFRLKSGEYMYAEFGGLNYMDEEYWPLSWNGAVAEVYPDDDRGYLTDTEGMTQFRINSSGYDYVYKTGAMPQNKDGFASDITVTTAAQLQQIAIDVNSGAKTYEGCIVKLGNDLDLSSIASFIPIGTSTYPFMGEFDGCGFIISGLTINRTDYNDTGLFGYIHNAYIHDVILEAPNVKGGNYYTGALVGMAQSTCGVTDVWVRPSATATPYVEGYASTGGIVGRSDKRLLMESCYFEGTVGTRYDQQDNAWVGALAANIKSGNINDCGTITTITRQDNGSLVKGLIGGMSTLTEGNRAVELTRCYAANSDASALPLVGSATEQLTLTSCYTGTPVGGNGMASALGSEHWYYYQEADKLPLPITLSKDLPGSDLAYYDGFYFLPNPDAPDTYHIIDYKGNGGAVTIPATVNSKPVTRIDSDVFQGNRTFTSVTISENITGIGHRSFEGCTMLNTLTINSGSTLHIGRMAFAGCPALTTINFYCGDFDYTYTDNEGVTDGGYAFSNCTNLTTLDFRSNANPLDGLKGKSAFSGCTNITDISASTTSANYLSVLTAGNQNKKVGIVSNNSRTLQMIIPAASTYYGGVDDPLEIPITISALAPGAFDDTPWLTGLTASSLTTISAPSFQNCPNLKSIDFSACSDLNNITVNRTAAANPFYGVSERTMIYLPSYIELDNDDNDGKNTKAISTAATNGKSYTVTLMGRTLYKDGYWNTLCLPFNVTLSGSVLEGAEVRTLSSTSLQNGTLTLNFSEPLTSLTAGTPYIIKWTKADGYDAASEETRDIKNPVFNGVAVSNTLNDMPFTFVTFKGTYDKMTFAGEDKSILFLGADNTLYYPESGATIGAQRAYFQLNGITANNPENGIKSFVLNFGDETTAVTTPFAQGEVGGETWFDLNGRRLIGQPSHKGIYLSNGKKIVVK